MNLDQFTRNRVKSNDFARPVEPKTFSPLLQTFGMCLLMLALMTVAILIYMAVSAVTP